MIVMLKMDKMESVKLQQSFVKIDKDNDGLLEP